MTTHLIAGCLHALKFASNGKSGENLQFISSIESKLLLRKVGSITGTHYHKHCSNKRCIIPSICTGSDIGVYFDVNWETLPYFVSSRETAFNLDSEILLGQQSFKQCAGSHVSNCNYAAIRSANAFFQYAILRVSSWYIDHFSPRLYTTLSVRPPQMLLEFIMTQVFIVWALRLSQWWRSTDTTRLLQLFSLSTLLSANSCLHACSEQCMYI